MNLRDLDCHQNWLQNLQASYDASRLRNLKNDVIIDMETGFTVQGYARALLLFIFTESGSFRDAKMLTSEPIAEIRDLDKVQGYSYLMLSLEVFLLEKQGEEKEANELLQKVKSIHLSDEDKAYLKAAKAYALSRLDQARFFSETEECCKESVLLDPDNYYHRIGYAIMLGRKRRAEKLEPIDNITGIKEELNHLRIPTDIPEPVRMQVLCFRLTVEQELTKSMILLKTCNRDDIRKRNERIFTDLQQLYMYYHNQQIYYDKIQIVKRMAMNYATLGVLVSSFPKHLKAICNDRAEELFKAALNVAETLGSDVGCRHILLEYSLFLCRRLKFEEAVEVSWKCWWKFQTGLALTRYIQCKWVVTKGTYDPRADIMEGITHLKNKDEKLAVQLYCIRGDYFKWQGSSENAIASWMEALKISSSDKELSMFRYNNDMWGRHRNGKVEYQDELFKLICQEREESRKKADYKMEFSFLRRLADFHKFKNPPDLTEAKKVLTEAASLQKSMGLKEENVEGELESLIRSMSTISEFESDLDKKFEDFVKIGSGSFGVVIKASHRLDKKQYAIKIVQYKDESVRKEVTALSAFDHSNVVRYYNSWIEELPATWLTSHGFGDRLLDSTFSSDSVSKDVSSSRPTRTIMFIQMELCNMSLSKWMEKTDDNRKDQEVIHKIYAQCLDALVYIHAEGYIHRDLMPSNIFVSYVGSHISVKVGDFGLAKYSKEFHGDDLPPIASKYRKNVYKARELHHTGYNSKADIFALDMIFFELLEGSVPNMLNLWDYYKYPHGFEERYPREHFILLRMIQEDPAQRCSAKELKDIWEEH